VIYRPWGANGPPSPVKIGGGRGEEKGRRGQGRGGPPIHIPGYATATGQRGSDPSALLQAN